MFFVRPIARDDLPAVFTLSERSGAGLTTLPANRERLSERIDRSLASFAGTADRGDTCYVFALVDSSGRRDVNGLCPFWEGLVRHSFAMEYSTADYLTGIGQKAFIAELMPKHPVYVNLLPAGARDAIGAVHIDTAPARVMLEQEGFRYEGYVDIFDAGPTLECFRDNIDAVRRSQVLPVTLGEEDPVPDSLTDDVLWLV